MDQFDENLCINQLDIKECSEKIIKGITKLEPINNKVTETFKNVLSRKENVVESFVEEAERNDILFYPEVSINGRNFYGLFRAADIFEMICGSLESPPKECHSFLKKDKKETFGDDVTSGLWSTILLIVGSMILIFLIAMCTYTQVIRRQMNQEMSMEVNKMVEHYVAMS